MKEKGSYQDVQVEVPCVGAILRFSEVNKPASDSWMMSHASTEKISFQDVTFSCLMCLEKHTIVWPIGSLNEKYYEKHGKHQPR